MTSNSAGSRHKGHDNVEYRVVRKHFGQLVQCSCHVISVVSNELFSRELISKVELTNASDNTQSSYVRATKVMDSVLTKIKIADDTSYFCKLVDTLQVSDLEHIARILETEARCSTLSSSSGLLQTSSDSRVALPPVTSTNNVEVKDSNPLQATLSSTSQASGPIANTLSSQMLQLTNFSISSSTESLPVQDAGRQSSLEPAEVESFSTIDSSTELPPMEALPSSQITSTSPDRESSHVFQSWFSTPQFGTSINAQLSCQSLRQLVWCGQNLVQLPSVTGDVLKLCVKLPELPVTHHSSLIDAHTSLLYCPIKLIRVQRDFPQPYFGFSLPATDEESFPAETRVIHTTHDEEEDVISTPDTAVEHVSSSTSRPQFIRQSSFQRSHCCHLNIEILQTKLNHQMSEIEFLRNEIEMLVKVGEEERQLKHEALEEHNCLKAQLEEVKKNLEGEVAARDKASRQIAEQEKEIDALRMYCKDAIDKQLIAEINAEQIRQLCLNKLAKTESLKKELQEVKRNEAKMKQKYVKLMYEMRRSEAFAGFEECIAEKNSTACMTLAPKLKIQVERERKRASLENDFVRAKEAEKLAEKTNHLLGVSKKKISEHRSGKTYRSCREDIRALDLVTPDKDIELLWY